jgi:hypothetical protein
MINASCDKDEEVILNDDNFITSVKLTSGGFTKDFEIKDNEVNGVVPYTIDDLDLALAITISDKATITPDPGTITSIKEPINFIVTAENGEKKNYVVDIKRELSPENAIVSFQIKTTLFETNADIDNETGAINQRVLPNTALTSIETTVIISDRATISPDPKTISDYTNPVVFTVTAENGESKEYQVTIELMNEEYVAKCDISNASKWFGGDDRVIPDYPEIGPRNVGTGQVILLTKDTYSTKFGFLLREPFRSDKTNIKYLGDLELKLNIRDIDGVIIATKNVMINGPFNGGWIDFDLTSLNLLLKKNTQYNFTYYLINGEALGVSSGSDANLNVDSGICGATGFSGTSKERENTSLEDWDVWHSHEWHFNFRLEGKQ